MLGALRLSLSRAALPAGNRLPTFGALVQRCLLDRWAPASPSVRWCTAIAAPTFANDLRAGKWSKAESDLLRQAVAQLDTSKRGQWAAVASLVPGRSPQSCRNHWLQCLRPGVPACAWTVEDDAELARLVAELGEGKWAAISEAMGGRRSPRHCLERWRLYLQPGLQTALRRGKWCDDEDRLLREAIAQIGADDWAAIASRVPGRNWKACRQRWIDHLQPSIVSGVWSVEEDAELIRLVGELGEGKWVAIAATAGRRSPRQYQARWRLFLQPSALAALRSGRWRKQEDGLLREAIAQIGTDDWAAVASRVPGRTWKACREHWVECINATVVIGAWSAEENAELVKLVTELGEGKWAAISAAMGGRRSLQQCRQRWLQRLQPGISKAPFSPQEDQTLLAMFERVGRRWTIIAESLPGRTSDSVHRRHRALLKRAGELPIIPCSEMA